MTRDSIPRDDLYGELEVSRQASVAAIEAAYRRLVKQHHPDVARSDDVERIKRLNLAREWLTDLDRRRRYDVSRGMSPTSVTAHAARRSGSAPGPSSAEPVRSFGVNANEVRIFLASLRGLDSERARRVFDGRAVAHAKGYTAARRAAAQVGQTKRKTEWQLAREAASVIARGKLGDTTLTEQVVDVLADTAGAIAIRDLLPKADYKTLLVPWTWKSARVVPAQGGAARPAQTMKSAPSPAPTPAAAGVATRQPATLEPASATTPARAFRADPSTTPPRKQATTGRVSISDLGTSPWQPAPEPTPQAWKAGAARSLPLPAVPIPAVSIPRVPLHSMNPPRIRVPSWLAAAVTIGVFFAGGLLGIGRPPLEQGVAGLTDAPTSGTSGAIATVMAPGTSLAGEATRPAASEAPGETSGGAATEPPGGPGGGATEQPDATPRPTRRPTTPPPTPAPTPPPPPTPTPDPECTVPNLISTPASKAEKRWTAAGFTGAISFWPLPPPNYTIGWQSLLAETLVSCTSDIVVQRDPP